MPVRIEPPDGADVTLYRAFGWGELARFYLLDGRQYRSDQACGTMLDVGFACDEVEAEDRTMLGADQEAWLGDELSGSEATWNLLAQQTVMTRLAVTVGDTVGMNFDQWDGYPAARRRVTDMLREVANPLVLTGDIHAGLVGVVTDDPDEPTGPALVPELVGPSVSSLFPMGLAEVVIDAAEAAPNVFYAEPGRRGYVVCVVTPGSIEAMYRYVASTARPQAALEAGPTWVLTAGDPLPREA